MGNGSVVWLERESLFLDKRWFPRAPARGKGRSELISRGRSRVEGAGARQALFLNLLLLLATPPPLFLFSLPFPSSSCFLSNSLLYSSPSCWTGEKELIQMRTDTLSNLSPYQRQLNFHAPPAVTLLGLHLGVE